MPLDYVFPEGLELEWDIERVIDFLNKCKLPFRRRKEVLVEICKMRDIWLTAEMVKNLRG